MHVWFVSVCGGAGIEWTFKLFVHAMAPPGTVETSTPKKEKKVVCHGELIAQHSRHYYRSLRQSTGIRISCENSFILGHLDIGRASRVGKAEQASMVLC
jgi:hypothetical protein